MKHFVMFTFIALFFCVSIKGQTKAELEEKRNKTLAEIEYVDNLLKATEKEKNESMNAVNIIENKLVLRESVIRGMQREVTLLSERIDLNTVAIGMMENDLIGLRSDYKRAVINSFKSSKGNPELVFILSAKDFNQGYKRIKYLQQVTKYRRRESEIIQELKSQVETSKEKLQSDFNKISELKSREEQQKGLLQNEQEKKKRMIKSLTNKERQLEKELENKKRIAKKIENEIARILEEEKKLAVKSENTPEQKLIGESFVENKGKLPWPVERGIITSQFGVQPHPVLKYVTENNIGIEITSSGTTPVRSIFKGEVTRVFSIPGANMTIIIRHGKYMTVYQNIINSNVKPGDKVDTKQQIGNVFCEKENGNKSILKFMIFEEMEKLDPESWIVKN